MPKFRSLFPKTGYDIRRKSVCICFLLSLFFPQRQNWEGEQLKVLRQQATFRKINSRLIGAEPNEKHAEGNKK